MAAALAASSTLPPPIPTTSETPSSRPHSASRSTVAARGFGSTSSKVIASISRSASSCQTRSGTPVSSIPGSVTISTLSGA